MFRQLDYQDRVFATLDSYLDILADKKRQADGAAALAAKPEHAHLNLHVPDFTAAAWEEMKTAGKLPPSRAAIPFSPRRDGCDRPTPNVVLKVPTGGGKTYLAVRAVPKILGRYLGRRTGFALWIVPNDAIYTQTLKNLNNRRHPYRIALDRAAGGRALIMEKTDRLDAHAAEETLCVMLLMLQSANRETQETLRMFRDRGDVHGFIPPEGALEAHRALREQTPNLDARDGTSPTCKDSLGNALRIIRPIVVLDEGHRAMSELAFHTLYGFNPCFVLELTATPKDIQPRGGKSPRQGRAANVLVEVAGKELDREGMIKMPLNLDPRPGKDWKNTLAAALERLRGLDGDARRYRANSGRAIRPMMLIQAERTGADQRGGGHIHADDVRDWLLTVGFTAAEIAIKTAEQNDLDKPENQDLLSPFNRVRVIITKQALQEGWDCPFAYVLCALAAATNLGALTQLVGRILRQPFAAKTGVAGLDECYVVAHHADTAKVIEAIKNGLERDGLGDLSLQIEQGDGGAGVARPVQRRAEFAKTEIYLPQVMLAGKDGARALDYETDVVAEIDWRGFDPAAIADRIPQNARSAEYQLHRIEFGDDGGPVVGRPRKGDRQTSVFDPVYAARMISDLAPNPFVAWSIVGRFSRRLRERGFDDAKLGEVGGLMVESLRNGLNAARDEMAEALFKRDVAAGRIQFRLRVDGGNWRMPRASETTQAVGARQLIRYDGLAIQKSLFAPVYEEDMNEAERDVAVYLDGEAALSWWHRNVARAQYGLQGWRKARIYPDFIFAVRGDGESRRITILETKGDQLDNLDTAYKRELLSFLSDAFRRDDYIPAGQLELVRRDGDATQAALILMSEWKAKLPGCLAQT